MPAIMGDARIKEKFQDEDYVIQVEQMFREKFLENLGVSLNTSGAIAKLGMAWVEMSIQISLLLAEIKLNNIQLSQSFFFYTLSLSENFILICV